MWLAWSVISSPAHDPFRRRAVGAHLRVTAAPERATPCILPAGNSRKADNRLPQRSPRRRKTRGASGKCRPSRSLAERMGSPAFRKSASTIAADEPFCRAEIFGAIAPDQPVPLAHLREGEAGIAGAGADVAAADGA